MAQTEDNSVANCDFYILSTEVCHCLSSASLTLTLASVPAGLDFFCQSPSFFSPRKNWKCDYISLAEKNEAMFAWYKAFLLLTLLTILQCQRHKMCPLTFLNYIKLVDNRILWLKNWEMFGQAEERPSACRLVCLSVSNFLSFFKVCLSVCPLDCLYVSRPHFLFCSVT